MRVLGRCRHAPLAPAIAVLVIGVALFPPIAPVVVAWQFSTPSRTPTPQKSQSTAERRHLSAAAAAALSAQIAGSLLSGGFWGLEISQPVFALGEGGVDWSAASRLPPPVSVTESAPGDDAMRKLGLRPPTDEKPQVTFEGSGRGPNVIPPQRGATPMPMEKKDGRSPIVVGLIYLLNEQNRPSLTDTLVITATAASDPDTLLAGAKFPIVKARFPMQFSMYDANILGDVPGGRPGGWYRATRDEDVFVTVRVCPEDSEKLPCAEGESSFKARGVCKLVRGLPGMAEGQVIRTPASLALE